MNNLEVLLCIVIFCAIAFEIFTFINWIIFMNKNKKKQYENTSKRNKK